MKKVVSKDNQRNHDHWFHPRNNANSTVCYYIYTASNLGKVESDFLGIQILSGVITAKKGPWNLSVWINLRTL